MILVRKKNRVVFFACALCALLFSVPSSFAQRNSSSSLVAEISRLEDLAQRSGGTSAANEARYGAFLALANLHRLAGNTESVLETYERALAAFPNDGRFLLEQGRFLISIGEHEKAGTAISALLSGRYDAALSAQGQYAGAQLEAFRSGNTRHLEALAAERNFTEYHAGIFYTLWKLTGLAAWDTRLKQEFPQSPEANIAQGNVTFAATPQWIFFPGRASLALPVPAPQAVEVQVSIGEPSAQNGKFLQAGFFSREDNARAVVQKINALGMSAQVQPRDSNAGQRWAVLVPVTGDSGAAIQQLKNAGIDSYLLP
jgi:tetratricopeptide (TPR) repeat protein